MKEIGFDVPDRKGFDSRWKTYKVVFYPQGYFKEAFDVTLL